MQEGTPPSLSQLEREFEALRLDHLKSQELIDRLKTEGERGQQDSAQLEDERKKNLKKIDSLQADLSTLNEKYLKLQGDFARLTAATE